MKKYLKAAASFMAFSAVGIIGLSSFLSGEYAVQSHFSFPYKKAGLTAKQAAAHLLNRFTYGATPNQVEEVAKMGLEKWFAQQLAANLNDDSLSARISGYDALQLSNAEMVNTFPDGAQVRNRAIKDGVPIYNDSFGVSNKRNNELIKSYMEAKGLRPEVQLRTQFINQKVLRAAYSNNQLQEVLTSFWFNHFNISYTKNGCQDFIPNYERDVIRPNALGKFYDLLIATAKSPAMLIFLDNHVSSGSNTSLATAAQQAAQQKMLAEAERKIAQLDSNEVQKAKLLARFVQNNKGRGLNENYAREVMELHTLGVDGGYTQQDVTQAAGILTGWTIFPMSEYGYGGGGLKKMIEKVGEEKMRQQGFVHDGDFLFAANRHDNTDKVVLGKTFRGADGYQAGVDLLNMLAHHPSTAKFICKKIAIRFVCDNPPASLIDKMAATFTKKDGDIKQVLITMVSAPEFWSATALREKIKSPFELAISTVRSLHADIKQPNQIVNWCTKMGEKLYYYQAPTGYPDRGQYWINTGSLLGRMNFGLALASQRIPGVTYNLAALTNHHEPESADAALVAYSTVLMPERDVAATVKRLTPLLNAPNLDKKIGDAAVRTQPVSTVNMAMEENDMMMAAENGKAKEPKVKAKGKMPNLAKMETEKGDNSMQAQVVGVIIGSPEFQRK